MSDILRDSDKKNEIPKVKIPKFATGGICNDAIFPKLDVFSQIDEIVKDIQKQKDNAMAMEFTKCIGELLRKNGVVPKLTEYTRNFETENTFETRFGVSIDELDFSEHDKVFDDKIARLEENVGYYKDSLLRVEKNCDKLYQENKELKQRIAELESKNNQLTESILRKATKIHELESKETSDLPFDPLECANYLINATYERETNGIERAFHNLPEKVNSDRYTVDKLEQIAEHLLIYCKHNKESEE